MTGTNPPWVKVALIAGAIFFVVLVSLLLGPKTAPPPAAGTPSGSAAGADGSAPGLRLRSGLVLAVPTGWRSTAGTDGATASLVGPDGESTIIATLKSGTREGAAAELGAAIDLGGGIVLTPVGQPRSEGDLYSNDFSVSGTPKPAKAIVLIKALAGDRVLALVVVATVGAIENIRGTARTILDGSRVEAPTAAPAAGAPSGDGFSGYMRGRYIVRFYSGSGYSEKHEMWFCSDGSFAQADDGGGFTAGGGPSAAFASNHGGTWSATGDASGPGVLTISRNDGEQIQFNAEIGEDGLYLNGERWLRGDNNACQ